VCLDAAGGDCYVASLVADAGEVTDLTGLGDGRLIFIEDHARVRVIAGETLVPEPALEVEDSAMKDSASKLSGLAVDPAFSSTGFVYVGKVESVADDARELSIVRYREVQDTFGEGAVIVSGLRLPIGGGVAIAVDGARHLYVAIPAFDGQSDDVYAGLILRFATDGTVPDDNHAASPIFARGYARPGAIRWDGTDNDLWLANVEADDGAQLARLPLVGPSAEWPRVPFAAAMRTSAEGIQESGRLLLIAGNETGRTVAALRLPKELLGGEPVAAVVAQSGDFHIVVRAVGATSAAFQIIRLRRP
jgi:hypothetical protein